jgi:hypothetical protein
MGGILPDSRRDSLIGKLRKAAQAVLRDRRNRSLALAGRDGVAVVTHSMRLLDQLWRSFPECYHDASTPPAEEIMAICDRYDRDKAEQEKLAKKS